MPAKHSTPLTAEHIRSVLDYDPATGILTWRERTDLPLGRTRNAWNGRNAGKVAGCVAPSGYLVVRLHDRLYRAHRIAWFHYYGEWPDGWIDHANRDGTDNRIANLRVATRAQNNANSIGLRGSASGLKGAYRAGDRWESKLKVDGRPRYLGVFDTPEEAHEAYMEAAREQWGEFARGG